MITMQYAFGTQIYSCEHKTVEDARQHCKRLFHARVAKIAVTIGNTIHQWVDGGPWVSYPHIEGNEKN